jgi:ParB/RepB/Spo0J family partition protein
VSKEDLSGLMQSINSVGLLEPIGVVTSKKGDSWEVAYGNRRFMAFSRLGLHSIPCVIHERRNDNDVDVKNLAENVQRRNISLAEVGRYATILEGEGLGMKELAVRLGCPVNYVESCIRAYKDVPEEYREELQIQVPGKKPEAGKLSISSAKAIVNAKKAYSLTRPQEHILYKAAMQRPEKFNEKQVPKYVAAMKKGSKNPLGDVSPVKTLTFRFMLDETEYDKLVDKHVTNGPFPSFTALLKAVLRGQKSISINFVE